MPLFFNGAQIDGSAADDLILDYGGNPADNAMNGGGGDDLILSDYGFFYSSTLGQAGGSSATAYDLATQPEAWTIGVNSDITAATTVPHASIYVEAQGGETFWWSAVALAGSILTLDIDYGSHIVGGSTDVIVEIYASDGSTRLARNDDFGGDEGSTSGLDSFLSFVIPSDGVYYIRAIEFGSLTFETGDSFILNVSLTGQTVSAAAQSGADRLNGEAGNDTLVGNAGADFLLGGNGIDTLRGGDGDDVLEGGRFGDFISGGGGADTSTYFRSGQGVVVDLRSGAALGGHAEGDRLTGVENLNGSKQNDVLRGDWLANQLRGAAGDDILDGGAGADLIKGGVGMDTAAYERSGGRVHINLATNVVFGGHANRDTLREIENITGSAHNDLLHGSRDANILSGGAGADVLNGGNGADAMIGGAGADRFVFSTALRAGNIDAILDFAPGEDVIELASAMFLGLSPGALAPAALVIGAQASDANHRIVYDNTTGALFFDADGDGAGAQVQFATLAAGLALTAVGLTVG